MRRTRKGAEDTLTSCQRRIALIFFNSYLLARVVYSQFFLSPLNLDIVPPPRIPVVRRSARKAAAESWRSSPHHDLF